MNITIEAGNKQLGMSVDEVVGAIAKAKTAGASRLVRTRVGWRGQILSMQFKEGMGDGVRSVR